MTAEAEKPFPETSWAMLGAAVDLAMKIVEANPAELLALITAARKGGNGTSGEHALLTAMRAIHVGAVAQVDLADAAIAVIASLLQHRQRSRAGDDRAQVMAPIHL